METWLYSDSLGDENTGIRASTIIEMGRTGNRDDIESIIGVLKNSEEVDWIRCCAAIALGRLSDGEAVSALLDALNDDDILVSRAVITALGDAGNSQAVPYLEAILEDNRKEELHPITVKVLGEIGGETTIPTLLRALESPNDLVRICAALALGELRAKQAVPRFFNLIEDDNEYLRAIAASNLGLMGDKRAVMPLTKALDDKTATVRAIAASSLGCLFDATVIPLLEKALSDTNDAVRKQAAAALSKIRSKKETE